jgi:hypothetical protein
MQKTTSLVTVSILAGIALRAAPADACSIAYRTPYDLFDAADAVALVDVASAPTVQKETAKVTVVETLKGVRTASMTVTPMGGTCSPGMTDGARGVVFVDASGRVIGAYTGFERSKATIAGLRRYAAATTDADRAAPLVDVAVSTDWSASFQAAYALAERVPLVLALDASARDTIVARLRRVGEQHTLIRVAARMQDARVEPIARRRGFDDAGMLAQVLAGRFETVTSVDDLADVIAADSTSARVRIAAFERCERVWARTLASIHDYAYDAAKLDVWRTRADACRGGTPVP